MNLDQITLGKILDPRSDMAQLPDLSLHFWKKIHYIKQRCLVKSKFFSTHESVKSSNIFLIDHHPLPILPFPCGHWNVAQFQ